VKGLSHLLHETIEELLSLFAIKHILLLSRPTESLARCSIADGEFVNVAQVFEGSCLLLAAVLVIVLSGLVVGDTAHDIVLVCIG
jgi:hypothetical protein